VLAPGLAAAGCGAQDAPSPGAATATASANGGSRAAVSIRNLAYAPATVSVGVGGTVVWTFEDGSIPHTVTADANSFGSDPNGLSSGRFEHTFGKAGAFDYHCDFHPTMKGTVRVR
jgi:plastocyanin